MNNKNQSIKTKHYKPKAFVCLCLNVWMMKFWNSKPWAFLLFSLSGSKVFFLRKSKVKKNSMVTNKWGKLRF